MTKKKLSIFIENDFILRSYLETSTFQKISNYYRVELVLTYRTNSTLLSENLNFQTYFLQKSGFCQFIQTVSSITYWYRRKHLSNSFSARILSLKLSRRVYYSRKKTSAFPSLSVLVGILFAKTNIKNFWPLFFLASKRFKVFIKKSKPDLIICMTSGAATSNSDLLSFVGKQLKIPVFTVVENWDNLTSKAVFNFKPDFVGVWGMKDKESAIELHKISENSIFFVGSPRVSGLLGSGRENRDAGGHLLFAGGSTDIGDEIVWLNFTIEFASLHSLPVVYVPHPSNYNDLAPLVAQSNSGISKIIPSEIMSLVLGGKNKRYPQLSFYEKILRETRIAISPYSTLLLESLLYGVPGVGLDFQDPFKSLDGWASEQLEHFAQLDFFSDYFRVTSEVQLEEVLSGLLTRENKNAITLRTKREKESTNPFYHFSQDFSLGLCSIIAKILS